MRTKKNAEINMGEALRFFFTISDWKERSLWFGVVTLVGAAVYLISGFLSMFIPFCGAIIFCSIFPIVVVGMFLLGLYLQGYMYDISRAVIEGRDPTGVLIKDRISIRIEHGIRLWIGKMAYLVPIILFSTLGIFVWIPLAGLIEMYENQTAEVWMIVLVVALLFLAIVLVILSTVVQMLVQYLVCPIITALYCRSGTVSSMFEVKEVYRFIKENFNSLIVVFAINLAVGTVMTIGLGLAWISVFCCVGVFILPVVSAVLGTYYFHTDAYLSGMLEVVDRENSR